MFRVLKAYIYCTLKIRKLFISEAPHNVRPSAVAYLASVIHKSDTAHQAGDSVVRRAVLDTVVGEKITTYLSGITLTRDGPVCQVESSPEILLVYRTHLVMNVHKILAADTRCKGVKELPKVGMYSSISRHRARA
jgi:hypothetical protein